MPRYMEKEQYLILKVIKYFQLEKEAGKPLIPLTSVNQRVSDALGISLPTVANLAKDGIHSDSQYTTKMSKSVKMSKGPTIRKKHEHAIRTRIYRTFSEDTTATDDDKKGANYESSTVDSGFMSGVSEEIGDSGIIDDGHKPINTPDSTIEEKKESMIFDSGVYLSKSLSELKIVDYESGANDLNNPKRSQALVDSSITNKVKPVEDIPWKIYYEQDEEGDTHLHMAIVQGFLEVALALIRAVPHPTLLDTPNYDNQTALHLAVETGQYKIARWLIVAGAKPCPRGPQGESPLHIAARKNDNKCVEAIAEPVQVKERDQLALAYQTHMYQPCDFDQWNFLGQTCVHIAAMHGHVEVLRHLIWYGANINAREGCMGLTALHYGVQIGNEELVKFLLDCKNIDVECISYGGKDALEFNYHFIKSEIRQTLLDRGFSSPYSSEDEFETDSGDDEIMYENNHMFSAQMVNASA